MFSVAVRTLDWTFAKEPLVRHLRPANSSPSTFMDALDLASNFRGHGWEWSHRSYIPHETCPANRIAFVFCTFLSVVAHAWISGTLHRAPIGYFLVARTYNNEHSVASNFLLFDEDGRWLTNPRPKPSPQTFFGSCPPIPSCNTMEAHSTELANAIVDSELAWRCHISRNVEEQINR